VAFVRQDTCRDGGRASFIAPAGGCEAPDPVTALLGTHSTPRLLSKPFPTPG